MSKWFIKFGIKSFITFDEKFQIEDIEFFRENNSNFAVVQIEAESLEESEKIGRNKLKKVLEAMEFTIDQKFSFSVIEIKQLISQKSYKREANTCFGGCVTILRPFISDRVEEIRTFLELSQTEDKIYKIAFNSFLRGLEIHEWNIEAFLNYFKSIEVISNQFIEKGKAEKEKECSDKMEEHISNLKVELNKENINFDTVKSITSKIHKIGFVELKKKISVALKELKLEKYNENVSEIVKIRNTVAAHGSSSTFISDEQLNLCRDIAKNMIIKQVKKVEIVE